MIVQKLRLQHGWSQEQLAELSGLSVRTIQRIERGNEPSVESLKSLAAVFDVDFASLKETDMSMPITNGPNPNVSNEEALALSHVRQLKYFYMHVAQYGVVIAMLVVINLMTSPRYLWFVWPALGWGVALLLHGMRTFDMIPFLNGDWERRAVEKRLGRKL